MHSASSRRARSIFIISDWNMEDIDGLTLLRVIRKHPKTQGMPFIMATGRLTTRSR